MPDVRSRHRRTTRDDEDDETTMRCFGADLLGLTPRFERPTQAAAANTVASAEPMASTTAGPSTALQQPLPPTALGPD